MNKSLKIALAVLVLLCGVYGALVLTGEEEVNEEEIYATTGMSSDAVTLTEIRPTSVMAMTIECGHGDTLDLKYGVEGWKVADNPDIQLDDSLVEAIVNPLCEVKSDRLLSENPADKANYGLEPARFRVTLTDSSDNVYTFNIGDKHPTTSKYYFNIEGEDKIYTVPTKVGMNLEEHHSIAGLIKNPFFHSATAATMDAITIETGDDRIEIVHLPDGDSSCYTADYTWFWKDADGSLLPLADAEFAYFTNVLEGIGFLQAVDYSDDPAVLEQYGLVDGVQHKIGITYESAARGDVTDVFYVGLGADGRAYTRVEGSWAIGSIVNKYDYFHPSYDTYKAVDFFKMQLDTVNAMDITVDGRKSRIETQFIMEVNPNTGAEKMVAEYCLGEQQLDGNAVKAFFDAMRNAAAEGVAESVPTGAPALEIVFDRNTESHTSMTLRLWEYDSSFYVSEFAGNTLLVNKMDVKTILDNLSAALASTAE